MVGSAVQDTRSIPTLATPPAAAPPPARSTDQRAQIVSLRAIFLRRMTKVMEERRTILSKLQMVNIPDRMMALQSVISETLKVGAAWGGLARARLVHPGQHRVVAPAAASCTLGIGSRAADVLQVNECTTELKANLQEEHLAGMEFIGTVFKTILSPLQKARAIVQSYPFYPDVYQVRRRSTRPC